MLLTTLTLLLTAADVQTTAANAEPQPKWAVNFALASSSIVNASFDFKPQVSAGPGLASITRQSFGTSSLSLERVLGEHLTGVVAATFGYSQFESSARFVSGGGMLGVHWYPARALAGFWVGPEVSLGLATIESGFTQLPTFEMKSTSNTQFVGACGRAGWTQRFGAHFLVAASAGFGANINSTTATAATSQAILFSQTALNLTVDGRLSVGLMF